MELTRILAGSLHLETALERLYPGLKVSLQQKECEETVWYDTYDLLLQKKGMLLSCSGSSLHLASLEGKVPLASEECPPAITSVGALPDGDLKTRIAFAGKRRVLARRGSRMLCTLRGDAATAETEIAHITLHQVTLAEGERPERTVQIVTIAGKKGNAFRHLAKALEDIALPEPPDRVALYPFDTEAHYTTLPQIPISGDMPLCRALSAVFRSVTRVMLASVDGVLKSDDPEYLHDMRVSLRRIRSIITQCRSALPQEEIPVLAETFRMIHGNTNRLRDLDVFLDDLDDMTGSLPTQLTAHKDAIADDILRVRQGQLNLVRHMLRSQLFTGTMEKWDALLVSLATAHPKLLGKEAGMPVAEYAKERLEKRFKEVLILGKGCRKGTPEALHAFRISMKKLRYLLEAFAPAVNSDASSLSASMKEVQDALGLYNDKVTQAAMLTDIGSLLRTRKVHQETVEAVRVLHRTAECDAERLRKPIITTITAFRSKENTARWRKILRKKKRS